MRYFAAAPRGTETRLSFSKSRRQMPSSGFSSVTHAGAAAGHEEALAFVVVQPGLDLLRASRPGCCSDRRSRRSGSTRESSCARRTLRAAPLDLRAERGRMLGKAAQLLEHLQALGPELLLGSVSERRPRSVSDCVRCSALRSALAVVRKESTSRRVAFELRPSRAFRGRRIFSVDQSDRVVLETAWAAYCSQASGVPSRRAEEPVAQARTRTALAG